MIVIFAGSLGHLFGFVSSASIRTVNLDDHLSLPPLAQCHGPLVTAASASAQCLERCPLQDKPHKLVGLDIFSARQGEQQINISSCETYRYTQKFTESWLFTRTISQISRERIMTNRTQCENIFDKVCNKQSCDTALPDSLTPSYSWTAEVTVNLEISVLTKHSALRYFSTSDLATTSSKLWIPGIEEEISRTDNKYYHEESDRLYLWNSAALEDGECPVKDFTPTSCLELGEDGYWCDKLKIFLTKKGNAVTISNCPDTFRRSNSYLYTTLTTRSPQLTDSKFIYDMEEGNSMNELIHMINHVLKLRDTENCIKDCLGIKTLMEPLSLLMAGYSYYQKVNNSHVLPCEPEFQCKLKIPIAACANPPLIRVECNSGDSWFKLDRGTTAKYEHCISPYKPDSDNIIIPTNMGQVIINKTGLYLDESLTPSVIAHPDPLSNPHQTGNLIKLRDSMRYHDFKSVDSKLGEHSLIKTSFPQRVLSLIYTPFRWIKEELTLMEEWVKLMIFSILSLLVIFTMIRYFSRKGSHGKSERIYNQLVVLDSGEVIQELKPHASPSLPKYSVSY